MENQIDEGTARKASKLSGTPAAVTPPPQPKASEKFVEEREAKEAGKLQPALGNPSERQNLGQHMCNSYS